MALLVSAFLVCTGKILRATIISSGSSRLPDESSIKRRQQLLLLATLIDPTNPIVRSGLGLSYLLLGMIDVDDRGSSSSNEEMNNDSSMQYIVQSIQHLKTAVKLTEESDDDHYSIVRKAFRASVLLP